MSIIFAVASPSPLFIVALLPATTSICNLNDSSFSTIESSLIGTFTKISVTPAGIVTCPSGVTVKGV